MCIKPIIIFMFCVIILSGCTHTKTIDNPPESSPQRKEFTISSQPSDITALDENSIQWSVETAQISGIAAETEHKDFERKNIHLTNVEEYVSKIVRPVYQEIVGSSGLSEITAYGITWYLRGGDFKFKRTIPDNDYFGSSILCVKYPAGTDGNEYERRYYFDSVNDELVFAFWTKGDIERRLYFYKSSIIRYIDENGTVFDNPTQQHILDLAATSLREGFVRWD